MIEITVGALFTLATNSLIGQGFEVESAVEIAREFVVSDLAGVRTHGVGKLSCMNFGDLSVEPLLRRKGAIIHCDGQRGNGFITLQKLSCAVGDACPENGVAIGLARNFSRFSSLYPYTSRLASRGYVGILMNTAGPAAVVPFGSIDPITGTNPICFSFPTGDGMCQTFDLATSAVVWGEIRQASLEGRGVRADAFLNSAGDGTIIPGEVNAVRAFGGAKGWAINLAIEILAGLLTGAKAGLDVDSEFDCGAILIAIDPASAFLDVQSFEKALAQLLEEVRRSRPDSTIGGLHCPGDRGRSAISLYDHVSEIIFVPSTVIDLLTRMGDGQNISDLSANPRFN